MGKPTQVNRSTSSAPSTNSPLFPRQAHRWPKIFRLPLLSGVCQCFPPPGDKIIVQRIYFQEVNINISDGVSSRFHSVWFRPQWFLRDIRTPIVILGHKARCNNAQGSVAILSGFGGGFDSHPPQSFFEISYRTPMIFLYFVFPPPRSLDKRLHSPATQRKTPLGYISFFKKWRACL